MSLIYANRIPGSQSSAISQVYLENEKKSEDLHKSSLKKLRSNDGKIYLLEANTYIVIEVTSLAGCPPGILGNIGSVSTRESLGIESILEIYDKKVRGLLQEHMAVAKKQLFNLFVEDFWGLLKTFENDFLRKAGSFSMRGIVLTWLKLLWILIQESPFVQKLNRGKSMTSLSETFEQESLTEPSMTDKHEGESETITEVNEEAHKDSSPKKQGEQGFSIVGNLEKTNMEGESKKTIQGTIGELGSYVEGEDQYLEDNERSKQYLLPSIEVNKEELQIALLRNSQTVIQVEYLSVVSLLWTLCSILPQNVANRLQKEFIPKVLERLKDNTFVVSNLKVLLKTQIFEYFFDSQKHELVKMNQEPQYAKLIRSPVILEPGSLFIPNSRAIQVIVQMI